MNELSSLSRCQWLNSGLATCGFLAAGGLGLAQALEMPALKGYTRPGLVTERGRAPGLQSRLISENSGGETTYAVVLAKGDGDWLNGPRINQHEFKKFKLIA